jgi:hypothetical protein
MLLVFSFFPCLSFLPPPTAPRYRVHLHITVGQLRTFRKFFHLWTIAAVLFFNEVLTIEAMFATARVM